MIQTTINNITDFFTLLYNSLNDSEYYEVDNYVNEVNNYLIVAYCENGNFYVAFKSLINSAQNVFNVEMQVFKGYNKNKGIHYQRNAIYKNGYPNELNYNPPQFSISNVNSKIYLKLNKECIICVYDSFSDNSFRGGFYIGEYLSYNESKGLFCGGDNQARQQTTSSNSQLSLVENTPVANFLSIHQSHSPCWLGYRYIANVNDYVKVKEQNWSIVASSNSEVNYSYTNTTAGNYNEESNNMACKLFPVNKFNKRIYDYELSEKELINIRILYNESYDIENGDYYIAGEFIDLFLIDFKDDLVVEQEYIINGNTYICFRCFLNNAALNHNGYYMLKKN
jgi:hypothetical protein